MSMRVCIILKDIDDDVLQALRDQFDLGLIPVKNKSMEQYLEPGELLYQATNECDDILTGLGAYFYAGSENEKIRVSLNQVNKMKESLLKDQLLASLEEKKKIEFRNIRDAESSIKKRYLYSSDAVKWVDILFRMIYIYGIKRVGIFYYSGNTDTENAEIRIDTRIECDIMDLSLKYLLEMESNTIVTIFDP